MMNTEIKNYIGGEWVATAGGKFLDNYNPATGEVYSHVPDSDSEDVAAAVSACEKVLPEWKKTSVLKRSEILKKISLYYINVSSYYCLLLCLFH